MRGSTCRPHAASTASMVAASMAADELTPLPCGTSDSMTSVAPPSKAKPSSLASTWNTPATYAAQCREWSAGEPRPHAIVRRASVLEAARAALSATCVPDASDDSICRTAIGPPLHGHARGFPDRPLQHERARVVGDAAHDVEPPGRAGDEHRRSDDAAVGVERPAAGGEPCRDARRGRLQVGEPGHASQPLARSDCSQHAVRRVCRSCAFAYPTQATSLATSRGASRGPPSALVTITPTSRAMSSVQRSYGWQQSARAARRGAARTAAAGRRRSDRALPSARRAGRPWRCTGPRTAGPCPAQEDQAAPPTTSSSIAASSARAPGKNREIVAKPWAMVDADDGRSVSGLSVPVSRSCAPRDGAPTANGPQLSHRCCFTSGISVCTASTMSASVAGPRSGATPVRIHAGRF